MFIIMVAFVRGALVLGCFCPGAIVRGRISVILVVNVFNADCHRSCVGLQTNRDVPRILHGSSNNIARSRLQR